MHLRSFFKSALLFCTLTFISSSLCAQQAWVMHTGKSAVMLEVVKSTFDLDCSNYVYCDNYSAGSANYYLGGLYALAPGVSLVAELPFAQYNATVASVQGGGPQSSSETSSEFSGSVIGNPLIGAAYAVPQTPVSVVLALRLPLASGEFLEENMFALNAGRYGDFERKDAFVRDATPLMTAVAWTYRPEGSAYSFKLQAGGKLVFYAGGTTTNAEVFCAFTDLNFSPLLIRAGYMVYTIDVTEHLQDIFGLSLAMHLGRFTPGIGVRILVGDVLPYYANSSVNANLSYRFSD
jgi:hypothetical protein